MKKRVYISGNLNEGDEGLIFDSISLAINHLQNIGYSDYEISLVRFIQV